MTMTKTLSILLITVLQTLAVVNGTPLDTNPEASHLSPRSALPDTPPPPTTCPTLPANSKPDDPACPVSCRPCSITTTATPDASPDASTSELKKPSLPPRPRPCPKIKCPVGGFQTWDPIFKKCRCIWRPCRKIPKLICPRGKVAVELNPPGPGEGRPPIGGGMVPWDWKRICICRPIWRPKGAAASEAVEEVEGDGEVETQGEIGGG